MMDQIIYSGKLFQVVKRTEKKFINLFDKEVEKNFQCELVRRPPGVRALITRDNKVLLNLEYRYELEDWDYRLPGGKVFDCAEDYVIALKENKLRAATEKQLKVEVLEEADIQVSNYDLMEVSHCGFTVQWDLYYFLVDSFKILPSFFDKKLEKNEYEYIKHCWVDYAEAYKLCLAGKISEKSSAFVLLKYLLKNYSKELLAIHDEIQG